MTARRWRVFPRLALWLLGGAALLSMVLVADSVIYWRYLSGRSAPSHYWDMVVLRPISRAFFFVATTPLIGWMARRMPLERPRLLRALGAHALFGAVFGIVAVCLYAWIAYGLALWEPSGRWALIYVPQWILFYGMVVGATTAFHSHARALARERQAVELRARLAEAQLRALKHQLHPHFVFNALQAVSTLIYRDAVAADTLLGQLSVLLRRLLDHLEREEVSLAEELAFVESYLAIERARLGERLSVSVDLPETLADCPIPPLLLQPLVENAVKHAAARRKEPSHIALTARRAGSGFELQVRDDGPGLPPGFCRAQFGVGLRTMCGRLAALYGSSDILGLDNAPEGGVVARLTLPLEETAGPWGDAA